MKTATVPNSPELDSFIEVTSDLGVSLECYENHFRKRYQSICEDTVTEAMTSLATAELNQVQKEMVERAIQKAVYQTALEQGTLIKCHESTLGFNGVSAPSEIALQGVWAYWKEVNG